MGSSRRAQVVLDRGEAASSTSSALSPEIAAVEMEIARLVSSRSALIPTVHRHLIEAGGKRLRPRLALLSARAVGEGTTGRAVFLAAAVETTHLASLLHDDIVDDARTRRGQPAVNVRWGTGVAVLAADWLVARLNQELIARGEVEAMGVLAEAVTAMCEAELTQLERRAAPWAVTEELCLEVVTNKTGALMAAACHLGALAGGGSANQIAALRRFGTALGTAFQLQDDLLDLTGDPETLGKSVGTDIVTGQPTLPILYALRHSDDGLLEELQAAVHLASPEALDLPHLRALVDAAGGVEYTRRTATTYLRDALAELVALPPGPAVQALGDLARAALERDH